MSSLSFRGFKQVDLPWLKSSTPGWAKTVRKMHYRGQQTLTGGGIAQDISLPMELSISISERGDNWIIYETSMKIGDSNIPKKTKVFKARLWLVRIGWTLKS